MIRRIVWSDRGASLVELGLAMVITSVMAVGLVTWINSAGAALMLHETDDYTVQELRLAKEQITRELRQAEGVQKADADEITVWVDTDDDDHPDVGEIVTWRIGSDGTLTRTTDDGLSNVAVSRLVAAESTFGYDAPDAGSVTQISIRLVAELDSPRGGGEPGRRTIATQIYLRNRP